ncbi:MAG: DUF89 family protein [Desulfurococcales archaeon]|nr:DUF89 family protein [Desulfurococcales archaeon]
MKLRLDCVVCIAKQALKAARLASNDEGIQARVLRESLRRLSEIEWAGTPPQLVRASGISDIILRITGITDPYKRLKEESNREALSLLPEIEELLNLSDDRLRTAVKLAIAGNIIDFAAVDKYDLRETINRVLTQNPKIDHYESLRNDLLQAETVLYFADNAGEIVFDKVLLQEAIRVRGEPFKKITFVVKGGPIINDATMEDAIQVGLNDLPNIEFLKVSSGREGTGPERNSPEVQSWIRNHDVVISKGQGNYEDLSELDGIYFLLMVKCPVVAEDIGAEVGDIIILRK